MAATSPLPAPPTPILGRSSDVAALTEMLASAGTRLVTITGPPGVGKTRLAVEVAAAVSDRFADGVVWLDLARIRDSALLRPEVLAALEPGESPARVPPPEATARELLIVLDNCEHLLDGIADLGPLLARSPRLRILATSRARLHLAAEREFPLLPLAMPAEADVEDLGRLARNPAIELLLARAPGGVRLSPQSARALVDVCVRLDGLPLALELAAARLRVFTPAELAFRLDRRMAVLTAGTRDAPARHRDLRSAIAWSYDLLPEPERAVFRRLSVLVGDWTLDAAHAVCGQDATAALAALLDHSLVRRAGDAGQSGRFRMLASVQDFAAEQLELQGETDETRRRHRAYFAATARTYEEAIGTERETESWHEYGRLQPDMRAALTAGDRRTDADATLWLAAAVGWYAYTRGALAGYRSVVDAVHAAHRTATDWAARAAGLTSAAIVAIGAGDLDGAERDLVRVAELAHRHGDDRRLAIARAFLGHVAREQARFADAAAQHAIAREIWARLGHVRGTAWAAHDIAILAWEMGDLPRAETLLREAISLFRDLDYDWAIAVCTCALGGVLNEAGAATEAAALFGEALERHERLDDGRGLAQCLAGLAEVALARGSGATAGRLRGAADTQRRTAGAHPSDWERAHLDRLDLAIVGAVGRPGFEQESRAGRGMPWPAVARLARQVVASAAPSAACAGIALTERQLEVAALIAAGRTNRQIGRVLGISEKTAEVHVRNIMAKLSLTSRSGIAAWAAARAAQPPGP